MRAVAVLRTGDPKTANLGLGTTGPRAMETGDTRTAKARIRLSGNGSGTGRGSSGSSRDHKVIRDAGAIRAIQQRLDHKDRGGIRYDRRLIPAPDSGSRTGRLTPAAHILTPAMARLLGNLTTTLEQAGQVIFHNGWTSMAGRIFSSRKECCTMIRVSEGFRAAISNG